MGPPNHVSDTATAEAPATASPNRVHNGADLTVWLAQSCYSFLHAPSRPRALLAAARHAGWGGLCLSDFDGVYGLAQLYLSVPGLDAEEASTARRSDTNPMPSLCYGAQVRLPLGSLSGMSVPPLCDPSALIAPGYLQPRAALVALSHRGYTALCRLLRYTHREGKVALMLDLDDADVPWPHEDVAFILPMRGWSSLCPPHTDRAQGWLRDLDRLHRLWTQPHKGKMPFYLAITPPASPLDHLALDAHLWAHDQLGIPLIATEDVFYASPADKKIADLMSAIRVNEPLSAIESWACLPNTARALALPSRLVSFCRRDRRFQTALDNNVRLKSLVDFSFSELHYEYPMEFVPQGMTAMEFLTRMTWEQAHQRYGDTLPQRVACLLDKELKLVDELGFADYFLTVWDIVRYARQNNILCQGRGSAANSCVCFVLGITAVDPMVSDVLFERFISRERGEPPDIDVDFEHERREEVIQYIYSRYGRTRAAMVANIITFRRQGALRACGKALGLKLEDVDALLKDTRDRFARDVPLSTLIASRAADLGIALSSEQRAEWLELAARLVGLPRHLGIHSGGFVISQHNLDALCPTEPATMEGRSVIQWCKDDLERMGLFKIDVLALGMLTAVRKTLALLAAHGKTIAPALPDVPSQPITLASIPPDCTKTYDMICQSRTIGTFQIESRAQMSIIPRLQPRCFYDLVIQIGIIRPGPIVAGIVTRYVKRRTGEEVVHYPDARMRPILERTLGVPVFQEQVMRIAMTVGDFTPGEADELRRSMGAWKLSGAIHRFEEKLRAGMKRNGIDDSFADEIYKQIEGFSEYGFPESHAISFAHLAYASAWLKAHYPSYFLAGLLNAQPLGFYSVHSLLQEARQSGVRLLPPCLLFSQWDHDLHPAPASAAGDGVVPDGILRLGLRLVHGLKHKQAQAFLVARAEWLQVHAPGRRHLALWSGKDLVPLLDSFLLLMGGHFDGACCLQLIVGGLLDNISRDRRMLLWHWLGRPGPLRADLPLRPFDGADPNAEAWSEGYDDLRDDFEVLGTSLRGHPLRFIKRWMWPFDIPVTSLTKAQDLLQRKGESNRSTVHVCGLITIKQAPPTAKGMIFVTVEDETGTIALTLTPQIAARYRHELLADRTGLLCVTGTLQGPAFGHSIKVTKVYGQRPRNHDPQSPVARTPPTRRPLVHSSQHLSLSAHPALWQEEQQ